MVKLPLSIRYVPGEIASSLASRLAQANQVEFREFLKDMGISATRLVAGEDDAVFRLSELSGLDPLVLRRDTPRSHLGSVWFRGHRFSTQQISGKTVRGCPECLKRHPGIAAIWQMRFVTICAGHRRPLVDLWTCPDKFDQYDVAVWLSHADLSPKSLPERRDPTEFELWVARRLEEDATDQGWLDQFEFSAATHFCAELGRAAISTEVPKWLALPFAQHCL